MGFRINVKGYYDNTSTKAVESILVITNYIYKLRSTKCQISEKCDVI